MPEDYEEAGSGNETQDSDLDTTKQRTPTGQKKPENLTAMQQREEGAQANPSRSASRRRRKRVQESLQHGKHMHTSSLEGIEETDSTTDVKRQRPFERIGPDTEAYREVAPTEQFDHHRIAAPAERQAFGRWLLTQEKRDDWIAPLAAAAKRDPRFPKDGDPEKVRDYLSKAGADGDMLEALDDAELDWASY